MKSFLASFGFALAVLVPLRILLDLPAPLSWGTEAHQAVPGDYDGDGTLDLAVYDPQGGRWFVAFMNGRTNLTKASLSMPGYGIVQQWGLPGDTPAAADYDGDKRTDFAVIRGSGETRELLIKLQTGEEQTRVITSSFRK